MVVSLVTTPGEGVHKGGTPTAAKIDLPRLNTSECVCCHHAKHQRLLTLWLISFIVSANSQKIVKPCSKVIDAFLFQKEMRKKPANWFIWIDYFIFLPMGIMYYLSELYQVYKKSTSLLSLSDWNLSLHLLYVMSLVKNTYDFHLLCQELNKG